MTSEKYYVEMIVSLMKSRKWGDRHLAMLACEGRQDVPPYIFISALHDKDERVRLAARQSIKGRYLPLLDDLDKRD